MQLQSTYVTLDLTNVSFETFFKTLEKESDYVFFLKENVLRKNEKVTVKAQNESVVSILNRLLPSKQLTYTVKGRQVIVVRQPQQEGKKSIAPVAMDYTVKGAVVDANGQPLLGVNIVVEGTTSGVITNLSGSFSLPIKNQTRAVLIVSYIGFSTKKVPVSAETGFLKIVLEESSASLNEVVVTALGIKREKKTLGYAVQEIKTDGFTENRGASVASMLQGKLAGAQISKSGSGIDGGTRIILRGLTSLSGNNGPLWVVDGLPVGTGDLNPDDIESISVLKGANAAALYGSKAQNGAIVVTTKKGTEGKLQVEYSGYVSATKAYDTYDFQDVYGQGSKGQYSMESLGSWGARMEGQIIPNWRRVLYGDQSYEDYEMRPQENLVDDFFRTAFNSVNSIGLNGGTDKLNARFSFTDTRNQGILPNNTMNKQHYNLNVQFKDKYFTFSGKATYIKVETKNHPGWNGGAWQSLIKMPRNIRLQDLKNPVDRDGYILNWAGVKTAASNPYQYLLDNNGNLNDTDRFIGMLVLTGHITDYLNVTGRIGYDRYFRNNETKNAHYNKSLSAQGYNLLTVANSDNETLNADLMLDFDKRFGRFTVKANLGTSTEYLKSKSLTGKSGPAILPNFVALSNGLKPQVSQGYSTQRLNSVLGSTTLGYNDYLFLNVTARNDWSSTLAPGNWSYFYPSVSLSGILSEMLDMPSSYFLKVRGSYAKVGNSTNPYSLYSTYGLSTIMGEHTIAATPSTAPFADLKPESTVSWEVGFDYRMFNNRLGIDFTYYNSSTINQILSITVPSSSGYTAAKINSGEMNSKGVELMVSVTPILNKDWRWDLNLGWGTNTSKNVTLHEKIKQYQIFESGSIRLGKVVMSEGEKFGDIMGKTYQRDNNGNILVDDKGLPIMDSKDVVLGNMLPDWTGSLGTTLKYKNIDISALVDVRWGGQFLSMTDAFACSVGNSARTLEGRDGIVVDGIVKSTGEKNEKKVTAEEYYSAIAGLYPIGDEFLYDADCVKLREFSVGYTFPSKWLRNTPLSSVKVALVGRDLLNIYKAAPVNPEFAENNQDGYQAFELAAFPSTRNIGFSLNVKF